jgi:hypothetical protein
MTELERKNFNDILIVLISDLLNDAKVILTAEKQKRYELIITALRGLNK